jgi:chromosome segregation ATPase
MIEQSAPAAAPAELTAGKTSGEIRAQIAVYEEFEETRTELVAKREELGTTNRGRTTFTGGETEEQSVEIHRRIERVSALRVRVESLDRRVRSLEAQIWDPALELASLRSALAAAEAREAPTSLELRARAIQLKDRIARDRELLEIARGAVTNAKRALSDPNARADVAKKTLARAREDLEQAESVYERTVAELQPQLDQVLAAVPIAEQRENEAHYEAAIAESRERIDAARERKDAALKVAREVEGELEALTRAHDKLLSEARGVTHIGYSG